MLQEGLSRIGYWVTRYKDFFGKQQGRDKQKHLAMVIFDKNQRMITYRPGFKINFT